MPLKSLIEMNTPTLNGSIIIQGMIEASTRGMHFPWDNIHLVKKILISLPFNIAYAILKSKKKKQSPQAPQISFSQDQDNEKLQERNSASAICILDFQGRGHIWGGLLQWKVNAILSFSLSLPFFNFFHNFIVFIVILNKFKKIIECEQSNNDYK